jgi:hypothetical protein
MKFRKKPVVIEAEQYTGQPIEGVCTDERCKEMRRYRSLSDHGGYVMPHIHTLEGIHEVTMNDWVITGVKGEKYPCKPDIFEATYEPVEG